MFLWGQPQAARESHSLVKAFIVTLCIENLARTTPAGVEPVATNDCSGLSRAQFFQSNIYNSFKLHRVNVALENAQKAQA